LKLWHRHNEKQLPIFVSEGIKIWQFEAKNNIIFDNSWSFCRDSIQKISAEFFNGPKIATI